MGETFSSQKPAGEWRRRERRGGRARRPARNGLAPVLVEVARHGALDAIPRVARGAARLVPSELGVRLALLPVAAKFGLHVVELAALVAAVRFPAVLIRGLELVVRAG